MLTMIAALVPSSCRALHRLMRTNIGDGLAREYVISPREVEHADGANHCYRRNLPYRWGAGTNSVHLTLNVLEQTNIIERRGLYTRNSSSLNPDISRSGKFANISSTLNNMQGLSFQLLFD